MDLIKSEEATRQRNFRTSEKGVSEGRKNVRKSEE